MRRIVNIVLVWIGIVHCTNTSDSTAPLEEIPQYTERSRSRTDRNTSTNKNTRSGPAPISKSEAQAFKKGLDEHFTQTLLTDAQNSFHRMGNERKLSLQEIKNAVFKDVNTTFQVGKHRSTMLHMAILQKDNPLLLALFKHPQLNANQPNSEGQNAFFSSLRINDIESAKLLLQRSELRLDQIDQHGSNGMDYLIRYASHIKLEKKLELLELTLKRSDCQIQSQTLIGYARNGDHPEVLDKILESKKIDVNTTNDKGITALHMATKYAFSPQMVQSLLKHGADLTIKNNTGNTPLHTACMPNPMMNRASEKQAIASNKLKIVKILLQQGARKEATNEKGETPEDIARKNGFTEIADYLARYR